MTPDESRAFATDWLQNVGPTAKELAYVPFEERRDFLQEAAVRFLTRHSHLTFQEPKQVAGYLRKICRGLVIRSRLRARRALGLETPEEVQDRRKPESEYVEEVGAREAALRNTRALLSYLSRWFPGEDAKAVFGSLRAEWKPEGAENTPAAPQQSGPAKSKRLRTYLHRYKERVQKRCPPSDLLVLGAFILRRWDYVTTAFQGGDPLANERGRAELRCAAYLFETWGRHEMDWARDCGPERERYERALRHPINQADVLYEEGTTHLYFAEMGGRPSFKLLAQAADCHARGCAAAIQAKDRHAFRLNHLLLRYAVGRFQAHRRQHKCFRNILIEEVDDLNGWLQGHAVLDLQVAVDTALWDLERLFVQRDYRRASERIEQIRAHVQTVSGRRLPGSDSLEDLLLIDQPPAPVILSMTPKLPAPKAHADLDFPAT